MKLNFWHKLAGLLLALFVLTGIAQAQTNDSVVSFEADVAGLSLTSPDTLPTGGTFWVVTPPGDSVNGMMPPYPCLPANLSYGNVYTLPNGSFLVDGSGGNDGTNANQLAAQMNAVSNVIELSSVPVATGHAMGIRAKAVSGPPDFSDTNSDDNGTNYLPEPLIVAPNYGTNLWIAQWSLTNGVLTGIASNTMATVQYELLTNADLTTTNWGHSGIFIVGSAVTNWTALATLNASLTNNLFFRLLSYYSSDGSGIPDWWEEQYGILGVDPNAQDSAGDGWSYYQKYEMNIAPNVFHTPAAPQGVTVNYASSTGTVTINWLPSSGNVTGYTITDNNGNSFSVSASVTSYTLSVPYSPDFSYTGYGDPAMSGSYQVRANYANGNSTLSTPVWLQPATVSGQIVPAPNGGNLIAAANIPTNAAYVRVFMFYSGFYAANNDQYNFTVQTNVDIPVSAFTNGFTPAYSSWFNLAVLPQGTDSAVPRFYLQSVDTNGNVSGGSPLTGNWWPDNFYDGRIQLKQNLAFQFRVADIVSQFNYVLYSNDFSGNTWEEDIINPSNYVYAAFYGVHDYNFVSGEIDIQPDDQLIFDAYRPFENNTLYRNFVYTPADVDDNGNMTTGVQLNDDLGYGTVTYRTTLSLEIPPVYLPPTDSTNSPQLGSDQFLCAYGMGQGYFVSALLSDYSQTLPSEGFSYDNNTLNFSNNVVNYWGLPILSDEVYYYNGNTYELENSVISPGASLSPVGLTAIYQNAAAPAYQTVEYDFWNNNFYNGSGLKYGFGTYEGNYVDNLPGNTAFSPTNTSQILITGVGQNLGLSVFAKLAVSNSVYSGVYGYLQQYLDQAYLLDANGNITTNTTGIVSPYGNYFATEGGAAALVTMPDPDTGQRGTGIVYAVSLNVDKNHDGNMDLSWNGADATSPNSLFVFWANNNYDRFTLDADDNTFYDDDVQVQDSPGTPNQATPDCNFLDGSGHRVIPCARDLQDFFRLWVCGIDTNLIAKLPAGSTVTLNWGDVGSPNSGNPTIDLFTAADPDGGTGYLTNSTIADEQIDSLYCPYIGRLAPGGSIQLNASTFANHWAGSHFIMCGVSNGTGGLNLTIADGSGNVLAQSTSYLQIVDIKQMYERWTVGDQPSRAPLTNAVLATENLPVGASAFQYTPPQDTNTSYILYVHGWNMETWEKDRFAEAAFKRLYWQGYHGRFGSFRWPTYNGFTGSFWQTLTDSRNYDNSEFIAWQSAAGLLNTLTNLNSIYPGHVYMLAHSMGNVVAGEALRLAGTNQVVNTYIGSQAAVPAHTYDATVTTPYLLQFTYTYPSGFLNSLGSLNYGPDTPNIYGNFLATNAAAAGKRISFYNINDFALAAPRWCFDQITKPDYIPPNNFYYYGGSLSDPAPWNHFYDSPIVGGAGSLVDIVTNLTNHYRIMAYAAESRSTALGATPGITNFVNLNLQTVWPTDTSGHNYADHFWHSAQFRGDCWHEWNYWNTLLYSSSYGFNISYP